MSNYFITPTDPEGFGVTLPRRDFRTIDFSALEFDTLMRAVTEYVKTYYKDEFNDLVANNGFMMIAEIVCYVGSVLSQRLDILSNESFLPTSQSREAVINHLKLIGQELQRQTPATTQIMCSVSTPVATDIKIQAGIVFNLTGPDNEEVTYELFAAPYDWNSPITIPANKFGTIGWAIEGRFADPFTQTLVGGENQTVDIIDDDILDDPIIVEINEQEWSRVRFLERHGPNDLVYVVDIIDSGMTITFGDDINGKAPLAGQEISVRYRTGGGSRGRIGTGIINTTFNVSPEYPVTAPVPVLFRNIAPSSGGYDAETNVEAKKRAPRQWSTHENITTADDYSHTAATFRHPVYGGVAKAVAAVFTQINANIVRVNILAEGANGEPVLPNAGLKNGLKTYLNQLNVLTDDVEVYDGEIKAVDIELVVIMYKNADAGSTRESVDKAVDDFFDLSKWNMGQPLYVASLYEQIMAINGVKSVTVYNPADDILKEEEVGQSSNAVAYNELITLGNKNIKIYYER